MARLRMMRCFLFRYCGNPKNLCMHRTTSRENREIPCSPVRDGATGRIGKSKDASQ